MSSYDIKKVNQFNFLCEQISIRRDRHMQTIYVDKKIAGDFE